MKRISALVMCFVLVIVTFSGCAGSKVEEVNKNSRLNYDEVCAVWISCFELKQVFTSPNKEEARESVKKSLLPLLDYKVNTVYLHTRAFSDAIYNSKLFPKSSYLPADFDYDALELFLSVAHELKLSVHAWVNPYRVSASNSVSSLPDNCPAKKWWKQGYRDRLIVCSSGIFYNPASVYSQRLIISGVKEICSNYSVDGIHFDDYFYPTTSASVDKSAFDSYKANGGALKLADFRKQCVSALVQGVYDCVKSVDSNILFGISPQANISNDENSQFADVKSWCKYSGFVDYLCPQIYYGFKNESSPFEECLTLWSSLPRSNTVKLISGLAIYKSGTCDNFASPNRESDTSPYFEWKRNTNIISRQISLTFKSSFSGVAFYSYSFLVGNTDKETLLEERANIKVEMQGR